MLSFQQKNVFFVFFIHRSRSLAFFLVEFRWPAAYFLFSLSFDLLLYHGSKFVDMTINLRLLLLTTRIRKQFPLSVFVLIEL